MRPRGGGLCSTLRVSLGEKIDLEKRQRSHTETGGLVCFILLDGRKLDACVLVAVVSLPSLPFMADLHLEPGQMSSGPRER